jgi:hypothetical protein
VAPLVIGGKKVGVTMRQIPFVFLNSNLNISKFVLIFNGDEKYNTKSIFERVYGIRVSPSRLIFFILKKLKIKTILLQQLYICIQ